MLFFFQMFLNILVCLYTGFKYVLLVSPPCWFHGRELSAVFVYNAIQCDFETTLNPEGRVFVNVPLGMISEYQRYLLFLGFFKREEKI